MATVREIANEAGVSKSTVSLVLNNKPGVSEEKRNLVLQAQRTLEALEAKSPEAVAGNHSVTRYAKDSPNAPVIMVLHPPVLRSSFVFGEVLRGIQSMVGTYGIHLRLVTNDPNASGQHVSRLYLSEPTLRPDGVLVFGAQQHEPLIEEANRLGIPCVVLGRDAEKYNVSGIGRDEHRYAYEATRHLVELGHQNIGFVGGEVQYDYLHNRVGGFRHALEDAGVEVEDAWIQLGHGEDATETLLRDSSDITALMFVNDTCASQGLPVIEAAGYRIPDDLSVISFDDTVFAREYDPPITSVSYRRFEEGQWAVRMLVDQIQFPYIERVQAVFRADLIERASCAAPRQ